MLKELSLLLVGIGFGLACYGPFMDVPIKVKATTIAVGLFLGILGAIVNSKLDQDDDEF